jgi:hypothetical protein
MLPGMGEAVTAHFFEAAAVLSAAPNLVGLSTLKAFSASRLRGRRWSMALAEGWSLVFSVDDAPPPSVLLEELAPRPQAERRAR